MYPTEAGLSMATASNLWSRMKTCGTCKETKPLDKFYRQASSWDGHKSLCKECHSIYRKACYQRDKAKELARHQEWCKNNPERRKAKADVSNRLWVETHRAQVRQTKRRYKVKRHAWELNGSFTQREWDALVEFYGNRCLSCKRPDLDLTQDHVIPLSKSGSNTIDNIQPLCGSCNSRKHTKTTDYR